MLTALSTMIYTQLRALEH